MHCENAVECEMTRCSLGRRAQLRTVCGLVGRHWKCRQCPSIGTGLAQVLAAQWLDRVQQSCEFSLCSYVKHGGYGRNLMSNTKGICIMNTLDSVPHSGYVHTSQAITSKSGLSV